MSPSPPAEPVRLSKIVSDRTGCSRREAELYIEGGWVRVDGRVVDQPGAKALPAQVSLDEGAVATPVQPATLLLHKPAGYATWPDAPMPAVQLLRAGTQAPAGAGAAAGALRPARQHFQDQQCLTDLEPAATGLVIYSQEFRVRRKLTEDAALVEHEVMVEVAGRVDEACLERLNRSQVIAGRAMAPARVSISRQADGITGLRFATKGHRPGRIAEMLAPEGLEIRAMKRIRIGRIALATIPEGHWRYLTPTERV